VGRVKIADSKFSPSPCSTKGGNMEIIKNSGYLFGWEEKMLKLKNGEIKEE